MYIAIPLRAENDRLGNPRQAMLIYEIKDSAIREIQTIVFSYENKHEVLEALQPDVVILPQTIQITNRLFKELKMISS